MVSILNYLQTSRSKVAEKRPETGQPAGMQLQKLQRDDHLELPEGLGNRLAMAEVWSDLHLHIFKRRKYTSIVSEQLLS